METQQQELQVEVLPKREKASASLIVHCGGKHATYEEVCAVPVPSHTHSWRPVPYKDLIDLIQNESSKVGLQIVKQDFALSRNQEQLFATFTCDRGNEEAALAIGLSQSYNKSLSCKFIAGGQVRVCDNLLFSGEGITVFRKNTVNVWSSMFAGIQCRMRESQGQFSRLLEEVQMLKNVPCNERRGYAFLGVMLGEKILTPTQANVAFGDWRKPRHEEFSERNLWSLYNCVTEGLKVGDRNASIPRYAKSHEFLLKASVQAQP